MEVHARTRVYTRTLLHTETVSVQSGLLRHRIDQFRCLFIKQLVRRRTRAFENRNAVERAGQTKRGEWFT